MNINGIPSAKTNFQRRPDVKDVIVFRAEDKRRLIFFIIAAITLYLFYQWRKTTGFL